MTDQAEQKNAPDGHIGDTPHSKRNLLIGGGLVAGAALIGLFYWSSGRSDGAAIDELQRFRQAMATQCKSEQFAKPPQTGLNNLYADSSRMQAVVHESFGNLQRGQASCDQIMKTLKSVDFPVE